MVIEGGCVTVAMYCIIQFYLQLKGDLAEHKPLLKVLAIKLVIFLSFWQTLLISFLTSSGAIKPSPRIQTPDIKIGIPSLLLCIEMAIFSVFHLWAFPWQVYDIRRSQIVASESAPGFLPDPKTAYQGGPFGIRALMDVFNPWDLVKAVSRGFKWFAIGRRRRMEDISYKAPSQGGSGLEPTRNQFTAFNPAANTFDEAPSHPYAGPNKPSRYHPLSEEEDSDTLLSHAQANPIDSAPTYPRPMERLPHRVPPSAAQGDISTAHTYDTPRYDPPTYSHPGQQSGTRSLDSQDTSYHGSARLTPGPPPDAHPLGPPGRKSHEQEEWEYYDGAQGRGESERDLGGGHGVGDNRF